MSSGPLTGKIIRYAIPLVLTYLLQLAFHAADMVVIGRWGSPLSLAAIGATVPLAGLLINVMTGISTGANVLAAQYFGARNSRAMTRLVHTAIALSIAGGLLVAVLGISLSKFMVQATDVPLESQSRSITYMVICFLGVPCQILYNFGCAILRAVGDTRSPLSFLIYAGVLNVVLNMFFVIVCGMDVAGVAGATVISQFLSAYLVIKRLQNNRGATRLILTRLRIDWESLRNILKLGVPAGLQSGCFSISNIAIQGGINTFGVAAVAGMTAGYNVEMLLYALVFAMHHTTIAVVGQNYGAQKYQRLIHAIYVCIGGAAVITLVSGMLFYYFSPQLIGIFNTDPEVIKFGVMRAREMFTLYFLLAFMDTSSGALRGLGSSLLPALSTLLGTCGLRILWVKYVFPHYHSMEGLLLTYPLSWLLVAVVNIVFLCYICKHLSFHSQNQVKITL